MQDKELYERAKARVEEIKGFYGHLLTYVVVNAFLIVLNVLTSPGVYWFKWPLFGWGIGVAVHAIAVFGGGRFLGREWEERKIRELMEREKRLGGGP
jgi:hypothetical protein